MYSSNAQHNNLISEMDLKEIFRLIFSYKKSIAVTTLLSTLAAAFYLYTTTKVYQSSMTIKIDKQKPTYKPDDLLAKAFGLSENNLDNEMIIVQSRQVAAKAAEELNMSVRYFHSNFLKTKELYKDSPFTVEVHSVSDELLYYDFILQPISDQKYRLLIEPDIKSSLANKIRSALKLPLPTNKPSYFSEVFSYGNKVTNKLFSVTVNRVKKIKGSDYSFRITPKEYVTNVLRGSLKVRVSSDKSSILNLSYTDSVPERAADALNMIAKAYQFQSLEARNTVAKNILDFVDEQLDIVNKTLQNSATNLENYKSSNIVVDPQEKAKFSTQRLNILEMQYHELSMQEEVFEKLRASVASNKALSDVDVGSLRMMDSPILPLIDKLREAESVKASLAIDYTEKHPALQKASETVSMLKGNLKGAVDSTLRGIKQRKASISAFMQEQSSLLRGIPKQEKQLSYLANNFTVNQKIYEYLLQKRAEMAIAESSPVSEIFIIDQAEPDINPIQPKSVLVILIGIFVGVFVGVLQAFIRNILDKTVKTVHDVEKRTPVPIYSVLPTYCDKRKHKYEEVMRILMARLEFGGGSQKPKIISFLPSVLEDEANTTSVRFASVCAASGKKVILLDLDSTAPAMHRKLGIDNSLGLSALLLGESSFKNVVRRVEPNFDAIAYGPQDSMAHKLITSHAMKKLLDILKERYDYIVIEGPTGEIVSEAIALMFLSDFCFVVLKSKSSQKEYLKNLNKVMKEHRPSNVALTLNGVNGKRITNKMGFTTSLCE